MCSRLSPQQLLGKLDVGDELILCDLEAGVITLNGLEFSPSDTVLVVTDPTPQAIDAAQRLARIAADLSAHVVVVANRVSGDEDRMNIEAALPTYEIVVVEDDPQIRLADRQGRAPADTAPESLGVQALVGLARNVSARMSPGAPAHRP